MREYARAHTHTHETSKRYKMFNVSLQKESQHLRIHLYRSFINMSSRMRMTTVHIDFGVFLSFFSRRFSHFIRSIENPRNFSYANCRTQFLLTHTQTHAHPNANKTTRQICEYLTNAIHAHTVFGMFDASKCFSATMWKCQSHAITIWV